MKVSLIVAIYKDTQALGLIFEALKQQTYENFEVMVAEDGCDENVKEFIENARKKYSFAIEHTQQDDNGIQKARSQNNGILKSSGEYLVFIDGDCIPYTTFIEAHASLAQKGFVVSGRRVNLGERYAKDIREGKITPQEIEKHFIRHFFAIMQDSKEGHVENGFTFSPKGVVYKLFISKKKNTKLLGCNFSCFRDDMLKINGFDEGYGQTPIADDTDLEWRFKAIGLQFKSAKNVANQFHLYHERKARYSDDYHEPYWRKFLDNKKNNKWFCDKGLTTH